MSEVNQADLDRLGMSRKQWDAHQARLDAEISVEVRVVGGPRVLREALRAAGVEGEIVYHHPDWPGRAEFLRNYLIPHSHD